MKTSILIQLGLGLMVAIWTSSSYGKEEKMESSDLLRSLFKNPIERAGRLFSSVVGEDVQPELYRPNAAMIQLHKRQRERFMANDTPILINTFPQGLAMIYNGSIIPQPQLPRYSGSYQIDPSKPPPYQIIGSLPPYIPNQPQYYPKNPYINNMQLRPANEYRRPPQFMGSPFVVPGGVPLQSLVMQPMQPLNSQMRYPSWQQQYQLLYVQPPPPPPQASVLPMQIPRPGPCPSAIVPPFNLPNMEKFQAPQGSIVPPPPQAAPFETSLSSLELFLEQQSTTPRNDKMLPEPEAQPPPPPPPQQYGGLVEQEQPPPPSNLVFQLQDPQQSPPLAPQGKGVFQLQDPQQSPPPARQGKGAFQLQDSQQSLPPAPQGKGMLSEELKSLSERFSEIVQPPPPPPSLPFLKIMAPVKFDPMASEWTRVYGRSDLPEPLPLPAEVEPRELTNVPDKSEHRPKPARPSRSNRRTKFVPSPYQPIPVTINKQPEAVPKKA